MGAIPCRIDGSFAVNFHPFAGIAAGCTAATDGKAAKQSAADGITAVAAAAADTLGENRTGICSGSFQLSAVNDSNDIGVAAAPSRVAPSASCASATATARFADVTASAQASSPSRVRAER